jgi:hypothetical protein
MNKLLSSVGLAIALATASLVAGCQLYFGDRDENSAGGGGGDRPPHFDCNADTQCAAGCFCSEDGECVEGGFCRRDEDCGNGFHCDVQRSSCVPNPACTSNDQCEQGSMCDGKGCVKTCSCTSDAEAIEQGAGWCDESRATCMPGVDPQGACTGAITCTGAAPKCPEGQVALIKDGCFTGECRAIAVCEAPPVCRSLQHQNDCGARAADCAIVTTGRNCRRGDGSACQPGDSGDVCRCETYTFAGCEDQTSTTPRLIIEN